MRSRTERRRAQRKRAALHRQRVEAVERARAEKVGVWFPPAPLEDEIDRLAAELAREMLEELDK